MISHRTSVALFSAGLAGLVACSAAPPAAGEGDAIIGMAPVVGTPLCAAPNVRWHPSSPGVPIFNQAAVLTHPSMHLVHWGAYWNGDGASEAQTDAKIWKTIGTDGRFWQPLAEYSAPGQPAITPQVDGSGSILFGDTIDPKALASQLAGQAPGAIVTIDAYTVISTLIAEFNAGLLPDPELQPGTVWTVVLPPNVQTTDCALASCGSIHNRFSFTPDAHPGTITDVAYAIIVPRAFAIFPTPYPKVLSRGKDHVIAHEIYEAVTDPNLVGWSDDACGEVADICELTLSDPIDGYVVGTFWSQAQGKCVGPANLDTTPPVAPTFDDGCWASCNENYDTLQTACKKNTCPRCPYGTKLCVDRCIPSKLFCRPW